MKQSAGILLYRVAADGGVFVVVVHPSGPYNKNAAWSLPKGEPDDSAAERSAQNRETLESTARREVQEEVGVVVAGPLLPLGHIDYKKSRKRVTAFAAELPADQAPRCASWEIDRCELLPVDAARKVLHVDQVPFLDRLLTLLRGAA